MITFVLDLDETLIYPGTRNSHDLYIDEFHLYLLVRPWLDEFIEYCQSKKYNIAVWSAGHKDYVYEIVNKLFKFEPLFIYTRDDCYKIGSQLFKRLSWCPTDPKTTYIIDDNPGVIYEKENYIQIKPYKGNKNDIEILKILQKIKRWEENPPRKILKS